MKVGPLAVLILVILRLLASLTHQETPHQLSVGHPTQNDPDSIGRVGESVQTQMAKLTWRDEAPDNMKGETPAEMTAMAGTDTESSTTKTQGKTRLPRSC